MSRAADVLREAVRSGKYHQTVGHLYLGVAPSTGKTWACAVGILCLENDVRVSHGQARLSEKGERELAEFYGFHKSLNLIQLIYGWNDRELLSLSEIADRIEEEEDV